MMKSQLWVEATPTSVKPRCNQVGLQGYACIPLKATEFTYHLTKFLLAIEFGVVICTLLHKPLELILHPKFLLTHRKIWRLVIYIWQGLRSTIHMSPGDGWKWKWPNVVGKSEMDLFWCISMTNNVKSCKKINGRVQTFRLGVFTMGGHWLTGALC